MMKTFYLLISTCIIVISTYGQKNIFEENFKNNKNKWALPSTVLKDSGKLMIQKNELMIESKQLKSTNTGIKITNKKINIHTDDEVMITATMKHISGSAISPYGIFIGEQLPDDIYNGYFFSIADSGFYKMYVLKNNKQFDYKNWTKSESVKTNHDENQLTIIKKRNQFHFLINGQWLFFINNDNITINSIGTTIAGKQQVAFNHIKIESFAKITDKKEQDKINDIATIVQQSQNQFINAANTKAKENAKVTWLPFINEANKNENILFGGGYSGGTYEDNWSYEKLIAEERVKQYSKYIEKVFGQFEKIEKPNVLGKKTYWLSKNPKYTLGTYVLLDEFNLNDHYFVKVVIGVDTNKTKEEIEKRKD